MKKYFLLFVVMATFISCSDKKDDITDPEDPGNGNSSGDLIAAVIKELKYDKQLNELYIFWDNVDTSWDSDNYIGTEFKFGTLLSGGSNIVTRRMMVDKENFPKMNRFRSVVVTPTIMVNEVTYRTIYEVDGKEEYSDWVSITKSGVTVEDYSAANEFIAKVPSKIQLLFDHEAGTNTQQQFLNQALGATQEEKTATIHNWYYSIVSSMSFDPYSLAFDTYPEFWMAIKSNAGVAFAMDYPNHQTGRMIVYDKDYTDLWKMPGFKNVSLHEMGHCVQWMPNSGRHKYPYLNGSGTKDFDRLGYQEGYPDALKIANGGFEIDVQMSEYKTALELAYENINPDPDRVTRYVWQTEYNTSGAFMCWLRCYDGDILRKLPWATQMPSFINDWCLEDAVKLILKKGYPDISMKELWREYRKEVMSNPDFKTIYPDYNDTNANI